MEVFVRILSIGQSLLTFKKFSIAFIIIVLFSSFSASTSLQDIKPIDIVVRAFAGHRNRIFEMLIPNLKLFVPSEFFTINFVLDEESPADHELGAILEMYSGFKVHYEKLPENGILDKYIPYRRMKGRHGTASHSRQLYSTFLFDLYSTSEIVGIIDTDAQFTSLLLPERAVNSVNGKIPAHGTPYDDYANDHLALKMPKGEVAFGRMESVTFPQYFYRETFTNCRNYIIKVHNAANLSDSWQYYAGDSISPANILTIYGLKFEPHRYEKVDWTNPNSEVAVAVGWNLPLLKRSEYEPGCCRTYDVGCSDSAKVDFLHAIRAYHSLDKRVPLVWKISKMQEVVDAYYQDVKNALQRLPQSTVTELTKACSEWIGVGASGPKFNYKIYMDKSAFPFQQVLGPKNYEPSQYAFSSLNRCLIYPRCLLFDCCDKDVKENALRYIDKQKNLKTGRLYECMFADDASGAATSDSIASACSYNKSMVDRGIYDNVWTFNAELELSTVDYSFYLLPPTAPEVYDVLGRRKEFKLLYLHMGEDKSKLSSILAEADVIQDSIFMSYTSKLDKCVFFPKSSYGYGRMSLYLTGRLTELAQGWLYNYFIFTENDPFPSVDNLGMFEADLKEWQPAVGAPRTRRVYSADRHPVIAVDHMDFFVLAYHREALEILHPYVLSHDPLCEFNSQLLQLFEANLLYRNHMLSFSSLEVHSPSHRKYGKKDECLVNSGGFSVLTSLHRVETPQLLRHCTIHNSPASLHNGGNFRLGTRCGSPRKKLTSYHLMNMPNYSLTNQTICQSALTGYFDVLDENCCSVDLLANLKQ